MHEDPADRTLVSPGHEVDAFTSLLTSPSNLVPTRRCSPWFRMGVLQWLEVCLLDRTYDGGGVHGVTRERRRA